MTPAVRKIVKENSIDIAQLKGTGPKGRILKHDVLDYLANGRSSRSAGAPRQPTESTIMQPQPAQNTSSASTKLDRTVPIRGIQRLMVKNMNAAAQV
jgi:pyruvate/2-oxoglutarate dehydrogenase complex dihydrolipoamide acyltransferase (E2) component